VKALWTRKMRAFRNRLLAIHARPRSLSARQTVTLIKSFALASMA
jgi:hypothetical protein